MSGRIIQIVSTAHWEGDPRLNRHLQYFRQAGHEATLTTFAGSGRMRAVLRALSFIIRSRAGVVLLPDPEMFVPGSIVARFTGKLPIVDIHEDYPRTAMTRPWVPHLLRPVVRVGARSAVALGRMCAGKVVVAAPELSNGRDVVVLNLPEPGSLTASAYDGSRRLVYVGDVTPERGVAAMIETLVGLDDTFHLTLIGRVSDPAAKLIADASKTPGLTGRIETTGQLSHEDAWARASGALAGLNLLTDVPAYRNAVATKVWEYMAAGVPPVVSALPGQAAVVGQIDAGLVCPSPGDTAATVNRLAEDPAYRDDVIDAAQRLAEEMWEKNRPDLRLQSVLEP